MLNIIQATKDYEFLQDYRESVIQDMASSLNSLKDELERRYIENVYIELESETKKLLNEDKRNQYIKILKRYKDDVFCFEGSVWYEYKVDEAICIDKLFYIHDDDVIIGFYMEYLSHVINEYNDLETEFEEFEELEALEREFEELIKN
jgi:hypothetical protein